MRWSDSFNVEDLARGEQAELAQLGTLVGMNIQDMYANVSELKRRDLTQQRGECAEYCLMLSLIGLPRTIFKTSQFNQLRSSS